MKDKIKAEIEEFESGFGHIPELTTCRRHLKWAEDLEENFKKKLELYDMKLMGYDLKEHEKREIVSNQFNGGGA